MFYKTAASKDVHPGPLPTSFFPLSVLSFPRPSITPTLAPLGLTECHEPIIILPTYAPGHEAALE